MPSCPVISPSSALPGRKFHTLDGLRGVAALGVVAIHAHPWISSFAPASAYLAVDLFFLLSGFVLAHAYERRFAAGMTALQFLRVRLIRLYPLFFLSVFVAGASALYQLRQGVCPISIRGIGAAVFSGLFMLPTPIVRANSWLFPLNAPAWSLFLELLVNIFYALAWRRLTNRLLVAVVAISGLALMAVGFTQHGLDVGPYFESAAFGLPRLFFAFFLGVLLRRWQGPGQVRSPWAWIAPSLLLALAMVMISHVGATQRAGFDLVCAMLIFPAMIWIGAKYEPASRLEQKVYASLGLTSYAIYLLHFPLLAALARCAPHFVHRWSGHPLGVDAVLLVALWMMATLVDRFYDVPVRQWLTNAARRRADSSAQAAPGNGPKKELTEAARR